MKKTSISFLLITILLLGFSGCGKQTGIRVSNEFAENVDIHSFVVIAKPISGIIDEDCGDRYLDPIVLENPNLVDENNRSGQTFCYVLSTETLQSGLPVSVFISLSHANGGWRDGYYFEEVRVADLISISLSEEDGIVLAALEYTDGTTQVKEGFMYFIT